MKVKASGNTYELVRDNANYFAEAAKREGFIQTVNSENAKVDSTDFFTNNGFIPKLGVQKLIVDGIFHAKVGKASRVHHIEDRGYIVYQLMEIEKEGIKPLKDVEATIKNMIRREKQKQLAEEVAIELRTKIQEPVSYTHLRAHET